MESPEKRPLDEINKRKSAYGPAEIVVWILLILGFLLFMLVYL